jgi:hypothetical protein
VTDIFREVEEDVRRERLEKLWKQYGDYIIAAAAIVIISIAGFELWQRYEDSQRQKASAQFNAAIQLASTNPAQAIDQLSTIAASGPSGYALLARLAKADALLVTGDKARAVAEYEALAAKDDGPIGSAARIRAAWALADTASRAQLQTVLAPLTSPTSAWRFMANEVLAYSDYRVGNYQAAEQQYRALAGDTAAPSPLRTRARIMSAFLKGGGNANFGFVPQAPTPAAPAANGAAPQTTQQGSTPQ